MTTETDATARFQALVADPRRRLDDYSAMVEQYYALVGDIHRAHRGPSYHMACYRPGQSRLEATAAHERDLADRAGLTADSHALDVCSGVGGPACTIAAHTGARITGVELVPARVAEARDNARARGPADRISFRAGDVVALPFADSVFTAAYTFEALCHVPDKARALCEGARSGAFFVGYRHARRAEEWP
ncbi:hypothetical protein CTZ27_31815 [Streptomyces griseocarneus]|nr:hypothetical protein CTZ27_31815 [Streptomyces griseocarneus]